MLGIVVSRADDASVHIGEQLRAIADWRRVEDPDVPDAEGGGLVWRSEDERSESSARASGEAASYEGDRRDPSDRATGEVAVEIREFDALHLELDDAAAPFADPDLLVFASRHAGETGPLLTAHHTGNFGPAEFGGEDGAFARACPNAHAQVLRALSEHAPEGYEVGTECTHHGPTGVDVPSMFVEVGSARPQWDDPAAAEVVARAILDLRGIAPDAPAVPGDSDDGSRRHLVGFGGGHYAPRFERIARETDWALGHVGADWALDAMGDPDEHRDVLRAAFERSRARLTVQVGDRPALEATIAELGYRVVDETWVRETDGVPLGLVERVEDHLGEVGDGVRFGDRVEDEGDLIVVDLPADLRDAAQGIDADRARAAVAAESVAFESTESGTRLGERAAVVDHEDERSESSAGASGEGRPASHEDERSESIVAGLAEVLESKYDAVTVAEDVVIATREAFDPEAARELGVPDGPAFGKLAAGHPVEVDGRRVDPEDVHSEETDRFAY